MKFALLQARKQHLFFPWPGQVNIDWMLCDRSVPAYHYQEMQAIAGPVQAPGESPHSVSASNAAVAPHYPGSSWLPAARTGPASNLYVLCKQAGCSNFRAVVRHARKDAGEM